MKPVVLVAAQDSPERRVICKMISRAGCEVQTADNGFLAVDALRTGMYDLVFLDRDVPLVDAVETTHLVREVFSKINLPVIGMFPEARDGAITECRLAGMNDHIVKPIALYKFQDILDRFVHLNDPAGIDPDRLDKQDAMDPVTPVPARVGNG